MKKRSKIDPTKISGDAVIPIDGGKGKSAKPRMMNGMVKRDLVAEWNAPIHRANVRPWNPFKDDSAKFKGRPEQWIYTRPGKITFVAVSFFLMGLFAWFFIPHAHHHGMRIYQENEVLIHSNIDPYADSLGQHPYVEDLISWVDSGASKAQKNARDYYVEQRPLIKAAAATFKLHWYFSKLDTQGIRGGFEDDSVQDPSAMYYDLIGRRLESMVTLLEEQNRDDFRIARDRCVMVEFFERHSLPFPPVARTWNDGEGKALSDAGDVEMAASFFVKEKVACINAINTGIAFSDLKRSSNAAYLRCCHLPEAGALGSSFKRVDLLDGSASLSPDGLASLARWAEVQWDGQVDDYHRPWREHSNKISLAVDSGIFVQEAVTTAACTPRESLSATPVGAEPQSCDAILLNVEVVWGYAYLGSHSFNGGEAIYLRDAAFTQKTWAPRMEVYSGIYSRHARSPVATSPEDNAPNGVAKWIRKEHLDCAWALAARTGVAVGAEEVRVDVWIKRGDVSGCLVDKLSITQTDAYYGVHYRYLAKAWIEPLLTAEYVAGSGDQHSSTPVYLQ